MIDQDEEYTSIYVGNLSFDTTEESLTQHMETIGEVASVRIPFGKRGFSKGFGIVAFVSAEDADAAIQQFNDTEFEGRTIFVREDRKNRRRNRENTEEDQRGVLLFVGNVSV